MTESRTTTAVQIRRLFRLPSWGQGQFAGDRVGDHHVAQIDAVADVTEVANRLCRKQGSASFGREEKRNHEDRDEGGEGSESRGEALVFE